MLLTSHFLATRFCLMTEIKDRLKESTLYLDRYSPISGWRLYFIILQYSTFLCQTGRICQTEAVNSDQTITTCMLYSFTSLSWLHLMFYEQVLLVNFCLFPICRCCLLVSTSWLQSGRWAAHWRKMWWMNQNLNPPLFWVIYERRRNGKYSSSSAAWMFVYPSSLRRNILWSGVLTGRSSMATLLKKSLQAIVLKFRVALLF